MSNLKYLLLFFLTSCSLPYLTNVNESKSSDLQIKNGVRASGEFTYYEQNPPMNGKINLIFDHNKNIWISVNSLFNLELFRVILVADTLCLINRIEKRVRESQHVRSDDNEEVLKNRLNVYHQSTEKIKPYYLGQKKLVKIDGIRSIEQVSNEIEGYITTIVKQ